MKYLFANWKMNLGIRESIALARGTMGLLQGEERVPQVVVLPSATALSEVRKTIARSRVGLGAQAVGPGRSGAFTGETGLAQLEDVGCAYALVGHSERRELGESDARRNATLKAIYESSTVTPILCVGESASERDSGAVVDVVVNQLKAMLKGVVVPPSRRIIVAYEPLWAIGSGVVSAPADALLVIKELKSALADLTLQMPERLVALYGGSVSAENAYGYLREPEIDGLLIGSASLRLQDLRGIVDAAHDVMLAQNTVWPSAL